MSWCDCLIGALIVIVLWFLYTMRVQGDRDSRQSPQADPVVPDYARGVPRRPVMRSKSNFAPRYKEKADPYTKINDFIDTHRGMRASDLARGLPPPWETPAGNVGGAPERFHQAGVHASPEQRHAAEQDLWGSTTAEQGAGEYNTERAFDSANDAMGYHETSPIEYQEEIVSTVLDPRSVENHQKWADAMMPWAGTAMTVDTLDEALEASTNFQGLRRPQAIAQYNALQVTERDMGTFLGNAQFNFLG